MPATIQLREIFDAIGDGIFVADANGRYLEVNPAGCAMFGYSRDAFLDLSIADVVDQSELPGLAERLAVNPVGTITRSEWLFRRHDGSTFLGELVGGRLADGHHQAVVRDISERRQQEQREALIKQEASHRTRNILALVQAVARQTAAASPETFLDRFEARIGALAASCDLLSDGHWDAIELAALVKAQLAPFLAPGPAAERLVADGPALWLEASAAQALGMALHELATNAAKYGALANDAGKVLVTWRVSDDATPRMLLEWSERGGPPVMPPSRTGFGTRMVARMIQSTFGAETTLDHAPAGLRWTMACPLAALGSADNAQRA